MIIQLMLFYQSTKEQGSEPKQQALSQLDAQITQLESTLAGYRVQYAGSGAQQAYASGLGSQLRSLKSQQPSQGRPGINALGSENS